jgi:hypothetical protein
MGFGRKSRHNFRPGQIKKEKGCWRFSVENVRKMVLIPGFPAPPAGHPGMMPIAGL